VTTYETGIDNVGKFDAHLEVHGDGKRVKVTYDTPFVKVGILVRKVRLMTNDFPRDSLLP
jgi:hypothetical protein